jgi:hypothetical protein
MNFPLCRNLVHVELVIGIPEVSSHGKIFILDPLNVNTDGSLEHSALDRPNDRSLRYAFPAMKIPGTLDKGRHLYLAVPVFLMISGESFIQLYLP